MGIKGIPLWSTTLIMLASLMTGAVISVSMQSLGTAYHICFVLAALGTVTFVQDRGIFLSTAQIPIIFAVVTPIAQWSVADSLPTNTNPGSISRTSIITAVYSLVSNFPILCAITIITVIIALVRYYYAMRNYQAAKAVAEKQNAAAQQSAQSTETAVTMRNRRSINQRPGQLTVDDLIRQRRERTAAATKARRERQAQTTTPAADVLNRNRSRNSSVDQTRAAQAHTTQARSAESRTTASLPKESRPSESRPSESRTARPHTSTRATRPSTGRFTVVNADDIQYNKKRFQVRHLDES